MRKDACTMKKNHINHPAPPPHALGTTYELWYYCADQWIKKDHYHSQERAERVAADLYTYPTYIVVTTRKPLSGGV